jgi:hypothetical protein
VGELRGEFLVLSLLALGSYPVNPPLERLPLAAKFRGPLGKELRLAETSGYAM